MIRAPSAPAGPVPDVFKGNNNLAVGLFVSLALAAGAVFSMWFAGTQGSEPVERCSRLFERDVSGRSRGGPVYFMGVQVGRVADMGIVSGAQILVRVDVDVSSDTPIDRGSYATLTAQGITGVNVINIATEPGDQGPLGKTDGFEHPLIPVRQTGLSALLAQAPDTVSKINALLDQANELLGETNRASIARTLANVDAMAETLALQREDIARLPREMRELVTASSATVNDVRSALSELQPDLAEAVVQIRGTAANLAQLTERFDRWLTDNEPEFQHFIDNGLGQAPELIVDLRSTLRELQKLLSQLQDDPSQLIHRPPDNALELEP